MDLIKLCIAILILEIIVDIWAKTRKRKPKKEKIPKYKNPNELPYERTYLLTPNEYNFYRRLEPIVNHYGLQILAKIRLADLIQVQKGHEKSQFYSYFNRIKAKHIDFAIADHMNVLLLIELDDSTHGYQNRIQRDNFVNAVLKKCNYTLIRTYGNTNEIEGFLKGIVTNTTDFNQNY